MPWIKLVHWNAAEAEQRARLLETKGFTVDFKICSIDATWSGLCFTRRK